MATIPIVTYSTVRKVTELINLFTEVWDELVGTGTGSQVDFYLDNAHVVPSSVSVTVDGVLQASTAYTVEYDGDDSIPGVGGGAPTSKITFVTAPGNLKTIYANYWYGDLRPSVVGQYIVRAEKEIDAIIGRSFNTSTTISEVYDGSADNWTSWNTYERKSFLQDSADYATLRSEYFVDRTLALDHYPIINVALIALEEGKDNDYSNTNATANLGFGSTTFQAQSFKANSTYPLIRVSLYLKYNTGTAADITVGLYADSGGSPTGSALASAMIPATSDTNLQYYDATFTTPYTLASGTTYHVVVSSASSTSTSSYYLRTGTSNLLTSMQINTSVNSGTAWTPDATKNMVFSDYTAAELVDYGDYRLFKSSGLIVFTKSGGKKVTKGMKNIRIVYSYGYASVPVLVEELATKLAAKYTIQSRLLGSPVPLGIQAQNIGSIERDIDDLYLRIGRLLEAKVVG